MKAWLFTGVNEPLRRIERETPVPGPDEVLLDVRAAGLCASDVHIMDGAVTRLLARIPLILGHEIAGVVAAVGAGVTGWRPGDRVVAVGDQYFMPGFHTDGGYASHCVLPTKCVKRLPDGVSFTQGATATDAGQASYGAVMGALERGRRIGVIGLGGLGLTGSRIAILNGAAEVYAAEPRREVWDIARGLGVKGVVEDVRELAPLNLDVLIDFAGFGVTTAGAIEAVKTGGAVIQVGAAVADAMIPTSLLTSNEVHLIGWGHPGDIGAVFDHMQRGELEILTTSISFDQIPEGLARVERGGVTGRLVAEI